MLRSFYILIINLFLLSLLGVSSTVFAKNAKIGMHVLHIDDVEPAVELLRHQSGSTEDWYYVTIPYTLGDLEKSEDWQQFFNQARDLRVIPIVRLVTRPDGDTWIRPTRKDVISQIDSLAQLQWPTQDRRIIIFNEVNHAKEWGGKIDPADYSRMFRFASLWAKSQNAQFIVLPAAMDLAAPNGSQTTEAFAFLEGMVAEDPEIFSYADAWNSHSYPNPDFSAPPTANGKNSLKGYQFELDYLKNKGITDLPVYITETGWETNKKTQRHLTYYYNYAIRNIWLPDERIVAVTPFIFKGDPGPFSSFSFVTADGKPTLQHTALSKVLGMSTTEKTATQ